MNRPKIICHILQSVDGNIDGNFFAMPELRPAYQAFTRIREEYACDAVISGVTTAAEIYANSLADNLPQAQQIYPRTDWQAVKADKFAVIIDGQGTIRWQRGMVERRGDKMHVITVLQENVSDAYISHLRQLFGIQSMLLSGGGIVDWAFLQAGLIDEISLVIPPVIDGGTGLASAFDDSRFAAAHNPTAMLLKDVQRLDGDGIWLRYQIKQEKER